MIPHWNSIKQVSYGRAEFGYLIVSAVSVALISVLVAVHIEETWDLVLGLFQLTLLVGLSVPLIYTVHKRTHVNQITLLAGLVVQMIGSAFMAYIVSVDGGDAQTYHELAQSIVAGTVPVASLAWMGTPMVSILTAAWYRLFGVSFLGSFFLAGFLAFWAHCLMIVVCVSGEETTKNRRRITAFYLFMPSLVMWHGLFGKEAFVALGFALTVFGFDALSQKRKSGMWITAVGLSLTGIIRPHYALMEIVALVVAYLLGNGNRYRFPATFLGIMVFVVLVSSAGFQEYIGVTELTPDAISDRLGKQSNLLSTGGSASGIRVSGSGVSGYLETLPKAIGALLLFPYPGQFRGPLQLIVSIETLIVFIVFLQTLPRAMAGALRRRNPVRLLVLAFAVVFMLTLSVSISANIGLMVRQRTFMWMALFLLITTGSRRSISSGTRGQVA